MATIQELLDDAQQKVDAITATCELTESQLDEFEEYHNAIEEIKGRIVDDFLAEIGSLSSILTDTEQALDNLENLANERFESINGEFDTLRGQVNSATETSHQAINALSGEIERSSNEITSFSAVIINQLTSYKEHLASSTEGVSKYLADSKNATDELISTVAETAVQIEEGADAVKDAETELLDDIRTKSGELASQIEEICGTVRQALESLQETITTNSDSCVETITEKLVAESINDFSGDCDTTDSELTDLIDNINELSEKFGGDAKEVLEKIDKVLDLIEKIKPVLDMVEDLT